MDNKNDSSKSHFLIVTLPAQGHINPSLELAKRLAGYGARVTYAASETADNRRMFSKENVPETLTFATYGDGHKEASQEKSHQEAADRYGVATRRRGIESLTELVEDNRRRNRPFTCVVYTIFLTWVAELARELHIPRALFWVEPLTVFSIFFNYFNGTLEMVTNNDPYGSVSIPSLAPQQFRVRDLPTIIVPPNEYAYLVRTYQDQIEWLEQEESPPKILLNSFQELEQEALTSVPDRFKIVPIGPLISSRTCSLTVPEYIHWLDTKPDSSVVYISFGTVAVLSKKQLAELCKALIESRRPFLWVIAEKSFTCKDYREETEEERIESFREELDEIGMVVSWCDQFNVLKHRSVGCFLTHCGWNSTLESLVAGVPVVVFPQWNDQMTNARILEECCRTGVRVMEKKEDDGEEFVVGSGEIRRCIVEVMEERVEEFRKNAERWRDLAAETVREGGSSFSNLKAFVDEHTPS